jgi:hypothetical protein
MNVKPRSGRWMNNAEPASFLIHQAMSTVGAIVTGV